MEKYIATRGLVKFKDRILIIRESADYEGGNQHGKYDFPGGKVEEGEDMKGSLKREIKEETGLDVEINEAFFTATWQPIVKGNQIEIEGTFFECLAISDQVELSKDHDDFKWIKPEDYKSHNLIKENVEAILAYLKK